MSTSIISTEKNNKNIVYLVLLAILWLLTAITLGAALTLFRDSMALKISGGLIAALFTLLFTFFLIKQPPAAKQLPHFEPLFLKKGSPRLTTALLIGVTVLIYLSSFIIWPLIPLFIISIAAAILTLLRLFRRLRIDIIAGALLMGLLPGS